MKPGTRNLVVVAVAVIAIIALTARYLFPGKSPETTLILNTSDGCSVRYSNPDGQKIDIGSNGMLFIQIDSMYSADTTFRYIFVRLQKEVDGKWLNHDDARPIDKDYPGQQTIAYPGLANGKFRAAYWRDSTDCNSGKITSAPNGLRLFGE